MNINFAGFSSLLANCSSTRGNEKEWMLSSDGVEKTEEFLVSKQTVRKKKHFKYISYFLFIRFKKKILFLSFIAVVYLNVVHYR